MISDRLDKVIREVPDFPKEGINFKDITPLLMDAQLTNGIIDAFINELKGMRLDAIVGIESRGFLFGFLLANKLNIPFVPIRKVGKLPGNTVKVSYTIEYGKAQMEMQKTALEKNERVLICDDLLATGGTAKAAAKLIEKLGAEITGFAFIIELTELKGKEKIKEYRTESLVEY